MRATAGPPATEGVDAVRDQLDRLIPVLRRMRKHWVVGLLGFAVFSLVVAFFANSYVEQYVSSTVVFHQPAAQTESVTGGREVRADPTLLRELLLRHSRLESLINEVGVHRGIVEQAGINVAVEEVRLRVRFDAVGQSTFRITYRGNSAEMAQKVTKWLAESLVEGDLERRKLAAANTKKFVDEELDRVAQELLAAEEELEVFVTKHPEFSKAAKEREQQRARTRPVARAPRRVVPKPGGGVMPKGADPDPRLIEARSTAIQELSNSTRELTALRAAYTEKHPDVRAAEARVAAAETKVKQTTAAIENQARDEAYDQVESAPPPTTSAKPRPRRRRAAPAPKKAPKPRPSSNLAALEVDFTRLQHAVENARDRQARLADEAHRADAATRSSIAGHDARVVILDEAFLPPMPIRTKKVFYQLGIPVAFLAGLALLLLRAILDDRVYDADDLVQMGYQPLLAVVPSRDARSGRG